MYNNEYFLYRLAYFKVFYNQFEQYLNSTRANCYLCIKSLTRFHFFLNIGTAKIEIPLNETVKRYRPGENITIKVRIDNPFNVRCAIWQRATRNKGIFESIDITLEKYKGTITKSTTNEAVLCLNDCDETDMSLGPYSLLATCSDKREIRSDSINLDIVKGKLILFSYKA